MTNNPEDKLADEILRMMSRTGRASYIHLEWLIAYIQRLRGRRGPQTN